jgi:two-component system, NtrC family, sensor histidine kinase PilS
VLALLEDLTRLEAEAQSMKLVALGRLTANIAHEIRNPLSAITHAADLMMEEKRAESRERLARIIRDNALRLDRMVKDVLELNRRDRVQVETIVLPAFLATFVEDFLRDEKLPADAVALEVESDISVQFDRVHLHQILWNLVRNAWRYGSKGSRSVQIKLERAGARVELQILDDGPGVPPECRAQLFEPFFTTDSTGTGLGLYISRELAGANGAQLDYQPRPNGSAFKLHWQGVKS